MDLISGLQRIISKIKNDIYKNIMYNKMKTTTIDNRYTFVPYDTTKLVCKKLDYLPDISQHEHIKEIDCSRYNNISEIPYLPESVEILDCSNNKLSYVNCPSNLKVLICSNNQIREIYNIPNTLQTLICENNYIENLYMMPENLIYFNCNNNFIKMLPTLYNKLEYLYCNRNKLVMLPEIPMSLKLLQCSHNNFKSYSKHITNKDNCLSEVLHIQKSLAPQFKTNALFVSYSFIP